MTSRERDAASSDIGDYDAFVRGLAAQGNPGIVPYAGFFKVLGSTADGRPRHAQRHRSRRGHGTSTGSAV